MPATDPRRAQALIAQAQKLARDSERHAILSASLATQAERLMTAGLRLLTTDRQVRRERPAKP